MENYNISDEYCAGSYGLAFFATRKSDGAEVVMKFFGYTRNRPHLSWILREIDNMRWLLVHDVSGVVKIVDTFLDSPRGYKSNVVQKHYRRRYPVIVMERLKGGELFQWIADLHQQGRTFSEFDVSRIFRQFMSSLRLMHDKAKMINLDLKTENIVCCGDRIEEGVKIIDFGMAVYLWDRAEHCQEQLAGTPAFLAPETISTHRATGEAVYSRASDMWQAGCILYFLLTARLPFGSETHGLAERILLGRPPLPERLSPAARDLLVHLFEVDPSRRFRCADVVAHPWLRPEGSPAPTADMGAEYRRSLQVWGCVRAFRRLLDRGTLVDPRRREALQAALDSSANVQFSALPIPVNVGSALASTQVVDVYLDPGDWEGTSSRGKRVRADNALPPPPTVSQQLAQVTLGVSRLSPLEVPISPKLNPNPNPTPNRTILAASVGGGNIVIDGNAITRLKNAFVERISEGAVQPTVARLFSPTPASPRFSPGQTLVHAGVDYTSFAAVMRSAGLERLGSPSVFEVFDWNGDGSVEYLEFLFTLSGFRTDVDWQKPESVARIYYDVFDVDGQQRLDVDTLAQVLNRLLQGGAADLAALVQAIDRDGDGAIDFDEFTQFFDAVLNLQVSTANPNPSHGNGP